MLHPLYVLLRKGQPWRWSQECNQAFKNVKMKLTEAQVLVHHDSKLPLRLVGVASAYGDGAVISHVLLDESEHLIAFASQTLSASERNYRWRRKLFHWFLEFVRFTNTCMAVVSHW